MEVIIQDASLLPESPGLPIWGSLSGSPGKWSGSSSTHRGRFLPGDWPQGLTLSCGHSWWVGPSLQWVQLGLGHQESQNTGLKENLEYHQLAHLLVPLGVPLLQPGRATSLGAQGASIIGNSLSPPEMLQKPVLGKPSTTLGGRRGVNTLSPEQRDYRVFIVRLQWATLGVNSLVLTKGFHMLEQLSRWGGGCLTRTGMMKQFAGAGRLQKAG